MSTAQVEVYKSQSQPVEESLTPPITPPNLVEVKIVRPWPESETVAEEIWDFPSKRRKLANGASSKVITEDFSVSHQDVLLLHGVKQKYEHTKKQPVPELKNDREMLVKVDVIGLNPIDWKAPDFGWGLPALPCISGRDLAGRVVKAPKLKSRFRVGDNVMSVSTDYRDNRKAAYQQYSVVSDFNACKLPDHFSGIDAAPLGVAFVAAALGLGICLGVDFAGINGRPRGPDLLKTVRSLHRDSLPEDIRKSCFDGIREDERPKPGEWIAIWGGSSASGCCAVQIAKLAGLKVLAVVDVARSGERMLRYGADMLVDRLDTDRAVAIIKSVTKGKLRFGVDTVGRATATMIAECMQPASEDGKTRCHLVGLTAVPKVDINGCQYHSVPIKAFHEAPAVGEGMMIWLEKLLERNLLETLDTVVDEGGLEGINAALDRLRDGSVNGPRIVVPLKP